MTLTTAALNVLTVMQSGALEDIENPIAELDALLQSQLPQGDLNQARSILDDARKAAYTQRSKIIRALQQLEQTTSFSDGEAACTSWELSA